MVHPQLLIQCPLFEIKVLLGFRSKHETSVVLGMILITRNYKVLQRPEISLGHIPTALWSKRDTHQMTLTDIWQNIS